MAVIDPRLEMARRARAAAVSTPNVVTLQQMLKQGRPAPAGGPSPAAANLVAKALSMQDVQNRMKALDIANGKTAKADGGLLADILGNSVVKTVLKPLEILDVPRRAIISGIHELSDAIGSGDASWSDFIDQAKDPTYGVGRYVHTGNKWADRLLGFVGDVALDPLTYVTFGGSHFAGASGRIALADKVLVKTGDEVLAKQVARFGRAALSAEQIAALDIKGLKKAGIYFMGKKVGREGLVGAASETLGSLGERTLNRLRFVASDSRTVKYLQNAFTTDVNREARLMLLRGQAPEGVAGNLIHLVNSRNVQRSAEGMAFTESQIALARMAEQTGLSNNEDLAKRMTLLLQGATTPSSPIEEAAVKTWRAWYDSMHNTVNEGLKKIDPSAELGYINNHVPLMMTDAAREELRSPSSRFAGFIKKGMDDGDPLSVFEPRYLFKKIREDGSVDWFGTKLTADMLPSPQTLADGTALTIERLNELARKGGFAGDVFESDIVKISNRYATQYAAQMGLVAKYEDLAVKGVLSRRDTLYEQSDVLFDPEAVAAAQERLAAHVTDAEDAHKALVESITNMRKALTSGGKMVEERLARTVGMTAEATVTAQRHEIISMIQSLTDPIMEHLKKLGPSAARVFDSTVEWAITADMLDAELKRVTAEAEQLFADMGDAALNRYGTLNNAIEAQQLFNEYSGRLAELQVKATQAQERFAVAVEMAPLIQARWDDIVAGRQFAPSATLTKDQAARLNAFSKAAGYRGTPESPLAIEGAFRNWVKASDGMQTKEWWRQINGVVDTALSTNDIADVAAKDVPQMLRGITGSSLESVQPMRVAGAWLLAHDSAVFGDAMPSAALEEARAELIFSLADAADSQLRASTIGKIVSSNRRDVNALKYGSETVAQIQAVERSFREYLRQKAIAAGWSDGVWNEDAAHEAISGVLGSYGRTMSIVEKAKKAGLLDDGSVSPRVFDLVSQAEYKQEQLLSKQHKVFGPNNYPLHQGDLQSFLDHNGRLSISSKDYDLAVSAPPTVQTRQALSTPQEAADRLAYAIERYRLQSDFTHRLIRATESMVQFGVAPTEEMARQLFNAAANDGLQRWSGHFRNVNAASDAIQQIRDRFASIITQPGWDGSRGVALRQAWREVSDTLPPDVSSYLDRAALRFGDPSSMLDKMQQKYWLNEVLAQKGKFDEAIRGARPGETAQQFYDEVGKARKLPAPKEGESAAAYRKRALTEVGHSPKKTRKDFIDEYYQSTVKPWYQANYPGRAGKNKALDALKERALMAQTKSPFRADAANWEIEEFFALLVGGETRGNRTGMSVMVNRKKQLSERTKTIGGLIPVRGALREDQRLASEMVKALRVAVDRNVDVDKFVADFALSQKAAYRGQRTPSMFADTLRWIADSIDTMDVKIAAAYDETLAAGKVVDARLAELEKARAVDAAVSAPTLEEQARQALGAPRGRVRDARLKQIGDQIGSGVDNRVDGLPAGIDPQRAARFRKLRTRLGRLQRSEDYTLALADQERVDLLNRLVGVDGWKAKVQQYTDGPSIDGWAISRNGESPLVTTQIPTESGYGGGTMPRTVANVVRDENGNTLTFTQQEWEALFIDDATAASEAGRLRGEIGRVNQQHKMIEARIELLQTELADNAATMSANKVKTIRRELKQLERKSKVFGDYLEQQRLMLRSMSPQVRAAAHEKFDALRAFGDGVFGDVAMRHSFMGGPQYHAGSFALGDSMISNASERAARLTGSWESSRSQKLLAEVASIQEEMSQLGFDSMLSTAEARAKAALELRDRAEIAYRNKLHRPEAPTISANGENAALAQWMADHPGESFGSLLERANNEAMRARSVTAPGVPQDELLKQLTEASRQIGEGVNVGELRQASGLPNYPSRMDSTPTRLRKAADVADRIGATRGTLANVLPSTQTDLVSSVGEAFAAAFRKQAGGEAAARTSADAAYAAQQLSEITAKARAAGREQEVLDSLLNGDGLGKLKVKSGTSGRTKTIKQVYGISNLRDAQIMFDSSLTFGASADLVRTEVIPSIERQAEALKGFAAKVPKTVKPDDYTQVSALYGAAKEFAAAMSDASGTDISRLDALAKLAGTSNDPLVSRIEAMARTAAQTNDPVLRSLTDVARVEAMARAADSAGDPMLRSLVESLRKGTVTADDPVMRAVASVIEASSDYMLRVENKEMAQRVLDEMSVTRTIQKISLKPPKEGFEDLAAIGLPGMQATPEIKKMLSNMQQLEDPQFARLVSGFLGGYTKFFKGYATLSPGFHVRNALSNTFMLLAAGSDVRNMRKGLRLYRSLMDHLETGESFAKWAESAALKGLSEEERQSAILAARTMFGAGGGNTSEQLRGMLRDGQSWVMDNWFLRKSSSVGQRVEGSARFMLAFDSAQKGMDLNGSMARVKRFLFDYQDVSTADKNMRAVVPFWLWMSRNLPLQLINQWANPRMYAMYGSFVRNIGQQTAAGDMLPSWMQEQGAIKVGQDSYLTPDLGFNRVQQQLAEMGDIPRMASYLNPGLRVPVELMGNRQLYNDVPFPSKQQAPAAGPLTPIVQALANTLGLTDTNAQGQQVWDPRWNYALRNMLPPLAQAERLMPSSDYGQQKAANSWRGYLGIPYATVTQGMKDNEMSRRQREIEQLAAAARSLGFQP